MASGTGTTFFKLLSRNKTEQLLVISAELDVKL